MEGSLALARSDLSRANDHLSWTEKMNEKGYASLATILSEKFGVSQLKFTLSRQLMAMDLYQRFTQPKTEKTLQRQVLAARTTLANEDLRLKRQVERLATLNKQLECCTIRAPHEGVVYYFKGPGQRGRNQILVEEGMSVRQRQELFYLPDLSELEVQMALNESVMNRVRVGMKAKIGLRPCPTWSSTAKWTLLASFPRTRAKTEKTFATSWVASSSPKRLPALHQACPRESTLTLPGGKRPRRSAGRVKSAKGHKVCYIAHEEDLEERQVELGEETTSLVEITGGLQEGELVVLNPPASGSNVESFRHSAEKYKAPPARFSCLLLPHAARPRPNRLCGCPCPTIVLQSTRSVFVPASPYPPVRRCVGSKIRDPSVSSRGSHRKNIEKLIHGASTES